MTITYDALDLCMQGPLPPPRPGPIPLHIFKLVQCPNFFNLDLTVQGPSPPGPNLLLRTCSNLFTVKHVRWKSRRRATYWNAFFCVHNARGSIITQTSGELIAQKPVHNHCQYVNTCVNLSQGLYYDFKPKSVVDPCVFIFRISINTVHFVFLTSADF